MMNTEVNSRTNRQKLEQLYDALSNLLAQVLRRGFYGTAAVELVIEDGTIQYIRRRTEQMQR